MWPSPWPPAVRGRIERVCATVPGVVSPAASVGLLLLTMTMLLTGIGGRVAPPGWIPFLLFMVIVGRVIAVVLVRFYRSVADQLGGDDTRWHDGRLRSPYTALLALGLLTALLGVPLGVYWAIEPPGFVRASELSP